MQPSSVPPERYKFFPLLFYLCTFLLYHRLEAKGGWRRGPPPTPTYRPARCFSAYCGKRRGSFLFGRRLKTRWRVRLVSVHPQEGITKERGWLRRRRASIRHLQLRQRPGNPVYYEHHHVQMQADSHSTLTYSKAFPATLITLRTCRASVAQRNRRAGPGGAGCAWLPTTSGRNFRQCRGPDACDSDSVRLGQ